MGKPTISIKIAAHKLVHVNANHGGYLAADCLACGNSGWLDGELGYAYGAKGVMSNRLIHAKSCPVNKVATKVWKDP